MIRIRLLRLKRTKNFRTINFRISPNARAAVYCTAIREGSQDTWEFLWEEYRSTNFASEKKIILDALGCSSDKERLNS